MRYYEARQRIDGHWAWTYHEDDIIYTDSPCVDEPCEHKTREDAERHYYYHEIKKLTEAVLSEKTMHECEYTDCEALTHIGLKSPMLFEFPILLCDKHRTARHVMEIRPFTPNLKSWRS